MLLNASELVSFDGIGLIIATMEMRNIASSIPIKKNPVAAMIFTVRRHAWCFDSKRKKSN